MDSKIIMPWEERPEGCSDVMWRYSKNPVIGRYHIPSSNSIFNSAVVPFGDGFAGVFRCDNKSVQMNIFAGFSKDGINWEINHEPISFKAGNTEMIESEYKYDPRVTWIEDRYWITWCNGYHGPTIGIGYTFDFKEFFPWSCLIILHFQYSKNHHSAFPAPYRAADSACSILH